MMRPSDEQPCSLQAIDLVAAVMFFGAFHFLGESGKPMTVLLQRAEIREPRSVCGADALSRHDDWNSRRIWNHADGDDAVGQLAERHLLGVTGHQALEGAPRRHLWLRQRGVGLRLPVSLSALAQVRPHLVTEI